MAAKYNEMTEQELDKQLLSFRTELRELRFTYAVVKSLQNPSRAGTLKKNIARILTLKRQRQITAAGALK